MMRQIIQIAVAQNGDALDAALYALDNDGVVWYYEPGRPYYEGLWHRFPALPEESA
jgi:hypothetical protein